MNAHVLVSLLETTVLADEVQVITTNDNGALHLHFTHNTGEDTPTDGNAASEWAFFVDVRAS